MTVKELKQERKQFYAQIRDEIKEQFSGLEGLEFVVRCAQTLLRFCYWDAKRDVKGFDIVDAGIMRALFWYPDIFGSWALTPEEVEFCRRKLLRYREQLSELGVDVSKLEKPVHPVSFFAWAEDWEGRCLRISPHNVRKHLPDIFAHISKTDGQGDWCRLFVKFERGKPLKTVCVRLNDLTEDGKTKKWWEE